ncbi:MAG: class I SAM-dependent methyltransferase [Candidatus Cloacimonetes bacterium]|jgi:SAM-dependent methyltransferase|nr:class I SAM-dependent methyltransferase [Candidatus Cloacimonadota bacterium]MBT5419881.1 class I SAM-dependent methyltransferase [Candidatus Cloacimonadota bacterium]
MAIPILKNWKRYFTNTDEGLGSSYERIILNNKLNQICKHFDISTVLEAPSFGFTGLSGINSVNLAKDGKQLTLLDNDESRITLIKKIWDDLDLQLKIEFSKQFQSLPFAGNSFDLSWNFSALWFVEDLSEFLKELSRVTSKAILLSVPNRSGMGYISQKILGFKELKKHLKEDNILPKNIKREMKKNGWMLIDSNYIDCPPWPDIGMPKDKFLKIFGLGWIMKKREHIPMTIMDHYSGKDADFPNKMMDHFWFERRAPKLMKAFWAHHKYFLFIPTKQVKN